MSSLTFYKTNDCLFSYAEKQQVQYMVAKLLNLDKEPQPDHAADALAAAICFITHENTINSTMAARLSAAAHPVSTNSGGIAGRKGQR